MRSCCCKKAAVPCPNKIMSTRLLAAARQAGCSSHATLHRLTYATSMLRADASLPAVKELLRHKKIEMTLRYVEVNQI
ncbi:MAG TPA: tyrosine-type recombinase/integrase, partial [Candidatus Bathyarchaeia archaeon]|nr:tyrosine-type recombinase/integrase [Candidatus Bathyarchaeia archaeon]